MKVSICATYVVEPLIEHIQQEIEFGYTVVNQVIQQLLNPQAKDNRLDVGVNIFCIRFSDWSPAGKDKKLINDFIRLINELETQFSSINIVFISPEVAESNYAIKNQLHPNIISLFHSDICPDKSVASCINAYTDLQAKIPYTETYYVLLAKKLSRIIDSLFVSHYKVIVLDCDYTLWHGACSELGPKGVEISKLHEERQRFFVQLKDKGFLICLCSKNSEDDVLNVFKQHQGMLLALNDVSEYRINWQTKSANIMSLSAALNIGVEHFIFVDDNPTECHEVKRRLPAVCTVIASDKDNNFLFENTIFDKYLITQEDKNRTQFYVNEKERHLQKNKQLTFKDYISSLSLKVCIREATTAEMARVVQLCHRTNQFNFSLKRYDNSQLRTLIQKQYVVALVEVSDRFGSYGMSGVLIYKVVNDYLHVDTFLLSCRVLGRTVEHRMLSFLADELNNKGLKRVKIDYCAGLKNNVALNSLLSVGGKLSQNKTEMVMSVKQCGLAEKNFYTTMDDSGEGSNKAKYNTDASQKPQKELLVSLNKNDQAQKLKPSVTVKTNNEIADKVSAIWLGKLNVTIDDLDSSFFHYGGSSLQFVFMLNDVFEQFNVAIPLDEIITQPTIAAVVSYIEQNQPNKAKIKKSLHRSDGDHLMLSNAQKRIWLSCQNAQSSSLYNMFGCWYLGGNLNLEILEKSCQVLVEQHPILRTKYELNSDEVLQCIVPYTDVAENIFNVLDGINYSEHQISNWKFSIAQKNLDLSSGNIFQCHLLKMQNGSYMFALLVHHIVCDGLSLQHMCRYISLNYQSLLCDQAEHPDGGSSYFDFIAWESDFHHSERYKESENYWLRQLENLPDFRLPMTEEIVENNFLGEKLEFAIDDHCFKFISDLAKQSDISIFSVFSTVFDVLLYHYSQNENIVTGTLSSGRITPGSVKALGFFSNLLVLKNYISGNDTFLELIKRKSDLLIEAISHQSIPFNHLVEKLKPRRTFARNPLCQILCVFEEVDAECFSFSDVTTKPIDDSNNGILFADFNSARFDLVLYGGIVDGELRCVLEYNKQLFKKKYMQNFCRHFVSLLSSIKHNIDIPIGKLALHTPEEKKQQLCAKNTPDFNKYFEDIDVSFDNLVKHLPKKVAVTDVEHDITYSVLDKIIKRLATYLINALGKGNEVIAVILPRGLASVELMMGVLKAKKIYFPINPSFPSKLILEMILDAKPSLVFCSKAFSVELKQYDRDKVVIYDELVLPRAQNFHVNNTCKALDLPAYLIYTSGSTGRPKGVLQTRKTLANLIHWQARDIEGSSLKFLHMATVGFDVSIQEVLSSLLTGGTLYIIDNDLKKDMFSLVNYIKQHDINIVFSPPSLLVFLCEIAVNTQCVLPSLQYVIAAGEALKITPPIVEFFKKNTGAHLINQYGPTETHVCTSYTLQNSDFANGKQPPIGVPIDNSFVYILNDAFQPVPLGVPGELYVGGAGVAKKYFNNPRLTTEKFVQSLAKGQRGAFYRTGDIVVRTEDELLHYIGRKDRQVQLRGHRIEISGVERVLLNYPKVSNVLVVLRGEKESSSLVAYFVSHGNVKIQAHSIKQHLANIFPCYMVPDLFIQIKDHFPLTPNGKIDYSALHISDSNLHRSHDSDVSLSQAMASPIATTLVGIISKLLNLPLDYIDVNDNFFELGMHSLHVLRLVMLIASSFNIHLSPKDIYFHQNIAMLSTCVQKALPGNYAPSFFAKEVSKQLLN